MDSPDTIFPDFSGHLGTCSQYGTYDFLETSSTCPSHVFRRAYKGSREKMFDCRIVAALVQVSTAGFGVKYIKII